MIRGGLWQKQKRTPVCSLCLYRTCLRGASRHAYSSSSEAAAWRQPPEPRPSQPPNNADNKGASPGFGGSAGWGGAAGWGATSTQGLGTSAGWGSKSTQGPGTSAGWGATGAQGPGTSAPPQTASWGNQGGSASWGKGSGAGSGSFATTTTQGPGTSAGPGTTSTQGPGTSAPPQTASWGSQGGSASWGMGSGAGSGSFATTTTQGPGTSAGPGATSTQGPGTSAPPQTASWGNQGGSASWGMGFGAGSGSFATTTTYQLSPSELAAKERLLNLTKPKPPPPPPPPPPRMTMENPFSKTPPIRTMRQPYIPAPRPPSASAKTLDYIGTLGRQDQPFSKKYDPFAPLDIKEPVPRPPTFTRAPTREKLGLDEGNWSQLKSQASPSPFQKGPGSPPPFDSFSREPPARSPEQNANEFWTRAKDKFPSVESPVERPTTGSEAVKAATPTTIQKPPQTSGSASGDVWKQMSAQIFDPKAVSATQAVDASTWDWADEPPDTTTKAAESTTKAAESTTEAGESEERPRSQDDGATQREPKPKASEPAPRQSSDATFETRERDRGDRGRRDRRDHVEREERGGRGKAQRRDRAENDDFDEESFAEARRRRAERKAAKERAKQLAAEEAGPQTMLLPELISVANLGAALGIKPKEFIKQMAELGFEDISKDNILTGETAALIAQEYGFDAQVDVGDDEDLKPRPPPEDPSSLPLRPPVVTIMGHVDHGKTTLLDYLRKSSIVDQEHGGITQHIGAFSVTLSSGNPITFLDTPGHAAFLSMRQRGANVTDIVILVVAADDSVKPQTIEALKHARAAKVPMIVAINKVDKESANIDRVKSDLVAHGVEIEDYGGDVQVVCVSGKTGQGMQDLEENILLLAEMLDIRSETDGMAEGWVLESTIKPIGRVATVLVKRGTLRPGDAIVAGSVATRIRTLLNEAGQEVDEAPPGTAVEILGWKDPPAAGDQVLQAPSEDKAKRAAHYRQELKERHEAVALQNKQDQEKRDKAAAEELEKEMKEAAEEGAEEGASASTSGEAKESSTMIVNFIIKGDVHGSVEACVASVLAIGSNEVRPRVLLSGPGQITEWEVEHATISGSRIINFNNNIPGHIRQKAEEAGVKIMDHNIIYHMAEDVRDTLSGYLTPTVVTKVLGEVEILQIFQINVHGRVYKPIAGCKVRTGQVLRKAKVRVMRNGEEVFKGTIDALKQGKKTVTEVKKGSECGISFNGEWGDFRQGDIIQTIEEVAEKRHL